MGWGVVLVCGCVWVCATDFVWLTRRNACLCVAAGAKVAQKTRCGSVLCVDWDAITGVRTQPLLYAVLCAVCYVLRVFHHHHHQVDHLCLEASHDRQQQGQLAHMHARS